MKTALLSAIALSALVSCAVANPVDTGSFEAHSLERRDPGHFRLYNWKFLYDSCEDEEGGCDKGDIYVHDNCNGGGDQAEPSGFKEENGNNMVRGTLCNMYWNVCSDEDEGDKLLQLKGMGEPSACMSIQDTEKEENNEKPYGHIFDGEKDVGWCRVDNKKSGEGVKERISSIRSVVQCFFH